MIKNILLLVALAGGALVPSSFAGSPQVGFDHGFFTGPGESWCYPCLTPPTNMGLNGLGYSNQTGNGPSGVNDVAGVSGVSIGGPGNQYNCISGWDVSFDSAFNQQRTSMTPVADTMAFTFNISGGTTAGSFFDSVSFDYLGYTGYMDTDPTSAMAALSFYNASGALMGTYFSNQLNLNSTTSWQTAQLDFAGLPSGSMLDNTKVMAEIYMWGGSSRMGVDNIHVNGAFNCVPEPSGSLLVAAASALAVVYRRRK